MLFRTAGKEVIFHMFRRIGRHFKEAFQGIFRHFAMAVSSASAVTFTLILASILTLIIVNVNQITKTLEEDIKIFVKIDDAVLEENIPALENTVLKVPGVSSVEYSDRNSELDYLIQSYGEEGKMYEVYREDIPLKRAFIISVKEGNTLSEVSKRLESINGIYGIDFGGTKTEEFVSLLNNVRNGGYVIILALTLLAIFLISNTIKITIYNRNREITIMRQVGATNGYIRQPFVIEGVFIGILGAIIPICITIFGYRYIYEQLGGQLISGMLKLLPVEPFAYQVSGFLLAIAVVVGLIGSLLSVNKYLRWGR